jgi:opacity protein-like surface antigen
MKSRLPLIAVCAIVLSLGPAALAQTWNDFNISAGAGFTIPVDQAGRNLNTGWNLDFRGGYNINRHIAADLDFNYNHWGLNRAALARFDAPDGHVGLWSLTFNPVYHLLPHRSAANAYVTAGFGIYHRNLTLTRPTTVVGLVCDPFFGCFPATFTADEVIASFNTLKAGFNAGGGLEVRLGKSKVTAFGEARYQRMFTNRGEDLSYVPVTFGVRW